MALPRLEHGSFKSNKRWLYKTLEEWEKMYFRFIIAQARIWIHCLFLHIYPPHPHPHPHPLVYFASSSSSYPYPNTQMSLLQILNVSGRAKKMPMIWPRDFQLKQPFLFRPAFVICTQMRGHGIRIKQTVIYVFKVQAVWRKYDTHERFADLFIKCVFFVI